MKVLEPDEAALGAFHADNVLLWSTGSDGSPTLRSAGQCDVCIETPKDARVVAPGDVIRVRENGSLVSVLFRRGAKSNFLFATERCNSLCVMCSQPPRDVDDSWRVEEMVTTVALIDRAVPTLGITGGEPTLLGDGLVRVIDACAHYLPDTAMHILTNGRLFADRSLAGRLASSAIDQVTWAVPLYADVAAIHDEVVGAAGAFAETLQGLFELGRHGAQVEVRIVLHKMTIPRLGNLAEYIYRRLPFVSHVALMGLEPMGYAKGNRDRLWIDPADYIGPLEDACFYLSNRGVKTSIYNLPLCVLPRQLWPFARQSISGWKNVYPPECEPCSVKEHCAGFFASAGPAWRSRNIRPLSTEEIAA